MSEANCAAPICSDFHPCEKCGTKTKLPRLCIWCLNPDKTRSELVEWLHKKLAEAKRTLSAREEAAQCWSGGTSKSWREVGCKLTKADRLKRAEAESSIAKSALHEVQMFQAVIEALDNPNA